MRLFGIAAWVGVGLALAGCGISPQPLPPGGEPTIAEAALRLETVDAARVRLRGEAGAVEDASALRITNLDGNAPLLEVPVAEDGSLTAELDGVLSDVLRLQARELADRSSPLDVTGSGEGQPVALAPVATPCLTLTPPLEVVGDPVPLGAPIQIQVVTATNDCATDVVLAELAFRTGATEFTSLVGGALPRTLAPAESFELEIGFKSMVAGDFEEVAFVVLESAGGPRRAITLRATTLP